MPRPESKNRVFFAEKFAEYFEKISETIAAGTPIFLGNPTWSAEQKREAERLAAAFFSSAKNKKICRGNAKNFEKSSFEIFVPSGGSGGKIRFIRHDFKTISASVKALQSFLNAEKICAFSALPPWHVSGLMPFFRAKISGGKFILSQNGSFRGDYAFPKLPRKSAGKILMNSLVPTQLSRILESGKGASWLRNFDFVLLGGAAVPEELLERAKHEKIKIGVGYGMTETAAVIAIASEPDFAAGTILPHSKIVLGNENRVLISSKSLGKTLDDDGILRGNDEFFETNDEGIFDENGKIKILGRLDRFINSGGEKIDPKLVESAILKEKLAKKVLVVPEKNFEWGEVVSAIFVPVDEKFFGVPEAKILEIFRKKLRGKLQKAAFPKRVFAVPELPFDAKGKVVPEALEKIFSRTNLPRA